MAPLVPGFLTSPKGQLIPDLGPASHSLVMSKSNGCTTESNSLWRSPRYKTLACKVRSTRKGQLHRPPPLLFPFWKLQRKIHRMIQILVPLCPAFPHPPNPPQAEPSQFGERSFSCGPVFSFTTTFLSPSSFLPLCQM